MSELLTIVGVFVAYLVIVNVVLPRFGIRFG
jgi:hypothetical protein